MSDRACQNCRWWNAHHATSLVGDCMNGHRCWRIPITDETGNTTFALMDSFEGAETKASDACGMFDRGSDHPPYEKGAAP